MMTDRETDLIAAAVSRSRMAMGIGKPKRDPIAGVRLVAIDIAATLANADSGFDRDGFLRACGFPELAAKLAPAPDREPTTRWATFQGEAWFMDHAIPVDDSRTRFGITESEYQDAGGDDAGDYDALQTASAAPQWVKDWAGPFTITFESIDGENSQ